MKTFAWISLLFLSLSSLEGALSLRECQQRAFENSETISLADLQVCIEKDRVDEIRGIAYPQFSAHGDYVAAGEANRFLKKHKKANAKASLTVPLYNFGGASNAISAQETLYEAAFIDNDRIKQEMMLAVTKAYYRLLESQKIERVTEDSLATLQEQRRIALDFHGHGLAHKNDVLLVEVQMAEREQEWLQAKHNSALAAARLNRLMGVPLEQCVELEDVFDKVAEAGDLCALMAEAKAAHPELLSLQKQIEAACYSYKAEKGALYPAIYAFSNYSTTNDYTFPYTHGVDVGISVQWNLYDGGTTWAKIRRKKKEYQELQIRYQALEEEIELRVRSAYMQVATAANKIPLALKSMRLSEENLHITQDQYREGLITPYDVLNDETRLAQARSHYYQALYSFHTAQAELWFASGISHSEFCYD